MKRLTAILMSCALITCTFASCGSDDSSSESKKAATTSASEDNSEEASEAASDEDISDTTAASTKEAATETTTKAAATEATTKAGSTEATTKSGSKSSDAKYEAGKVDEKILGTWTTSEMGFDGAYEFYEDGTGSVIIDSSSIVHFDGDKLMMSSTAITADKYTYDNGHFDLTMNGQNFLTMDKTEGDNAVLDGTYKVTSGTFYDQFKNTYANTDNYEFDIIVDGANTSMCLKNCFTYSADGENLCIDKGASLFNNSSFVYTLEGDTLTFAVGNLKQELKKKS